MNKYLILILIKLLDFIFIPITFLTAIWIKFIVKAGIYKMPFAEKIFMNAGVLPVNDHYYQPLINPAKHLKKPLNEDRHLPGIDLNINRQLELLKSFSYNDELLALPIAKPADKRPQFFFNNNSFEAGDAEYLFNMIRYFKPQKMIEIGSGLSTLMAIEAFNRNKKTNENYQYEHICIEPYEQPWLEQTSATIIRKKAEDTDLKIFATLNKNDILFIDSSHVIRPQGDVLFEILEILPTLKSGVLIHIHDIFTPKDYPKEWIFKNHFMWNEQYLLEAFLSNNNDFEILGALNYLKNNHQEALFSKCPVLAKQPERQPGSFWMRRK